MTLTEPLALIFPGQGSQVVGMGRDLVAASPVAQAVFATADAALGFPLSTLCFTGPQTTLDDTYNVQPAILTTSIAVLHALREVAEARGITLPTPAFCAGHSLGEYSALVAAEALDFGDAVRLVRERGRLMKRAGEAAPGGMAALIGGDDATAEKVAAALPGVQIANYNAPGQVVLSGAAEGIAQAPQVAQSLGVRRVIPLAVTIAAHSKLMASAVDEYREAVLATPISVPRVPVIGNVHAQPLASVAAIQTELVDQLTSSVRWTASVEYLLAQGVRHFIELGPGNVLTGLVRRIARDTDARALGNPDDIQAFLA